jgi:hypothetical protein
MGCTGKRIAVSKLLVAVVHDLDAEQVIAALGTMAIA